jgi:hypothetical protein
MRTQSTRVSTRTQPGESERIPTCAEIFSDGTMLELVRDPVDLTRTALLHWDGQRSTVGGEFVYAGVRYVPMEVGSGLLGHLPTVADDFTSTDELFDDVRAFLTQYSGLNEEEGFLVTAFCFATFFPDCAGSCPCVRLHGSVPSDAIALLRALACVCRLPELLADAASTLRDDFRRTRLICQADPALNRMLAPLQLGDFGISKNGSVHQIGGATAIYAGDAELRSPFAQSCLPVFVTPAPQLLSAKNLSHAGLSIRNRLLSFRLKNFAAVQASSFDAPQFRGQTRDFARTFGGCIQGSPALIESLLRFLRERDEAERVETASRLPSIVVEALRVLCHERRGAVLMGEIAKMIPPMLSRLGEPVEKISARRVGTIVNELGFRTRKLDSSGRGICLLENQCRRIHQLARAHSLPPLREQFASCPYCRDE